MIDEEDRRVVEKRLPNDVHQTLALLAPYRAELPGIAVESTLNWYWRVDGLTAAGYPVRLANTTAIQPYEGLKHTDDRYDGFHLTHLLRLKILAPGHIYPKAERAVRDLMGRRMGLLRARSAIDQCAESALACERPSRISRNLTL